MGRKHRGKRRNCSLRAISPFPTVFSKDLYCRHKKPGLVWERVNGCQTSATLLILYHCGTLILYHCGGTLILYHCGGTLILYHLSTLILYHCGGTLILYHCGTLILYHCGTLILYHCGSTLILYHCGGTLILYHCGTLNLYHCGTLILYHCGTLILYHCGTQSRVSTTLKKLAFETFLKKMKNAGKKHYPFFFPLRFQNFTEKSH